MDFESLSESNDSDDYDDFFFQSIQRYNTLQMFSLENIPQHLLQVDDISLCVVSKRCKGENSELLKLQLPEKLVLSAEQKGRSKENDFKVLSGIYTGNLVYLIDKLENTNKIITSENNVTGLQVYSFTDSVLGSQKQKQNLSVTPWIMPEFAVIQEKTNAICSKCCHEPLFQVDVSVGKKVREIRHPFLTQNILHTNQSEKVDPCSSNNLKCKPLSSDLIALLNTHTGVVVLHDLRTSDSFASLPVFSDQKLSKEVWTLSGFDYKKSLINLNYIGILSNRTSFCIYDRRTNSVVVQNTGENPITENYNYMKLKLNKNCDQFSISGLSSVVQIFRLNENNFKHVFSHNGHCPSNLSSTITTDHIWLQAGGNEYVVSVSDNGTLNCWDYKA